MRCGWTRGGCCSSGNENAAGIRKDSAAIVCGPEPLIVPRAPSLELYVLPNGGGQLIYEVLHPDSQKVRTNFKWS